MALLLQELAIRYKYALNELDDDRVKDWFLMGSPWPVVFLSCLYLYVILDFGPKFMKSRKPFNIDKLLVWYNAIQIIACAFIVVEGVRVGIINYDVKCEPVDYSDAPDAIYVARIAWFYFLIKFIDLLDTVFFILRKKEEQVSFLHVYHHCGMVILSWVLVKYFAGGSAIYIIVINSFVHIVMYGHYLLTAYNKKYKKSAWWKKHITQLQLFQFGVLLIQHLNILVFQRNCGFPFWVISLLIPQNLTIFCLFADFYYQNYIKKKPIAE